MQKEELQMINICGLVIMNDSFDKLSLDPLFI